MLRYGVPASGPMDRRAFKIANAALGNPPGAPCIEVSTGGLVLDCIEGHVTIAVAGGGFQVSVAGATIGSWTIATLQPGSRLTIRRGGWGSWAYLAFAGSLQTNRWLASAATHLLSGFGGGVLASGGRLVIEGAETREERCGDIAIPLWARPRHSIRVVCGPQDRCFSAEVLNTFLAEPFSLTGAYDRMGVRLAGPVLRPDAALDMPSEPIVRGSVQVAGDGVATVLLADHQTTGGYPKIATILSDDLDGLAQLRGGDSISFHPIDPRIAINAVRDSAAVQAAYLTEISRPAGSLAHRLLNRNLISGVVDCAAIDPDAAEPV